VARKCLTLSDEVRRAIEHAGASRYALARRIGCSQALLSRFMSRTGGISLDVLDRLAKELRLRLVTEVDGITCGSRCERGESR
jgi:ribosome-binding protein aMBF1 (putative translation factor)